MTPTNEQIAAWLDPERKRDGWWNRECQENMEWGPWHFTGPDFYAPGVCEEEVVRVVLEVKDLYYERDYETTEIKCYINNHADPAWRIIHAHHPTACIMALAKIKEVNHV